MSDKGLGRLGLDAQLLRSTTDTRTRSTPETMRLVLYALLPGTFALCYLFGAGVLVNLLIAISTALLFEAMALHLRGRDIWHGVSDGSAALTGALLALSVSPLLPAWQLLIGTGIAILLAKHVFGGLGHNPFNPAMVAFAVLIVSFPADMSHWPESVDPRTSDEAWNIVTAQTVLDRHREVARTGADHSLMPVSVDSHLLLLAGAWLVGGLCLLWLRVITWHAPLALLGTLALCHGLGSLLSPGSLSPVVALVAGASVFGAFFIVTDPVSGAASTRGRILFGIGVGLLTFLIRQFGSWPEGFAFAVLIMNGAVPLIDRLDRPRYQ